MTIWLKSTPRRASGYAGGADNIRGCKMTSTPSISTRGRRLYSKLFTAIPSTLSGP
jgi:hypothetical protein